MHLISCAETFLKNEHVRPLVSNILHCNCSAKFNKVRLD